MARIDSVYEKTPVKCDEQSCPKQKKHRSSLTKQRKEFLSANKKTDRDKKNHRPEQAMCQNLQ
jgi:hypothetical protein